MQRVEEVEGVPPHHLEEAVCFRCQVRGKARWTVSPFTLVECGDCGQNFVSPRLNDEGRATLYGDPAYFDHGVYGSKLAHAWQRAWINGRLNYLEAQGPATQPRRLLEIGCAYGMFLEEAANRDYDVLGLEFSEAAASAAERRLGVPIATGVIEDLGSAHTSDVVAAWDVIEHVSNPRDFLDAAFGLINPGGMLLLSLPDSGSMPARVLGRRWWNLKLDRHIWQFTTAELDRLLTEAGYTDITIHSSSLRRTNLGRLDSMFASARRPAVSGS